MLVKSQHYRTIWSKQPLANGLGTVSIIDQTKLPHAFEITCIENLQAMIVAIKTMQVRGAPLIGAAAAYGLALAVQEDVFSWSSTESTSGLRSTNITESRQTALVWHVQP